MTNPSDDRQARARDGNAYTYSAWLHVLAADLDDRFALDFGTVKVTPDFEFAWSHGVTPVEWSDWIVGGTWPDGLPR